MITMQSVTLALAATLAGYEPPDLAGRFTYCELGCGRGKTSLVLAAVNPEAEFHAIDFNPAHIAQYGKQLGAKYFVTGKVAASDERTEDARRVQYFFFMQVIDVETSAIRWQHKAYVTKMVR